MASGKTFDQDYRSTSVITNFVDGKQIERKTESGKFKLRTAFRPADGRTPLLRAEVATIEAQGDLDLHELAFPQLGEAIQFAFWPDGAVESAGSFDRSSLFFVPPVSFPENPVQVGDTWLMTHQWSSRKTKIPLRIELVSVLKAFWGCGSMTCAEVDLSGRVEIVGLREGVARFSSSVRGTALFVVEWGFPAWLIVGGDEEFHTAGRRVRVESCLVALTTDPDVLSVGRISDLNCRPGHSAPLRAKDLRRSLSSVGSER
jgi:hypothetical protein